MTDEAGREYRYRPAWWLPGGHAQTLWGKFGRARPQLPTSSEIVPMPDGDSVELHHLERSGPDAPRVLMLHGLEGSRESHYVGGLFGQAAARRWNASLLLFRGCGATPNAAPRFYHSGETTDIAHVFDLLSRRWPNTRWVGVGVSLGGNVLLKWLGERGDRPLRAAAAVSVPYDLEAGARAISRGFSRIYDMSFLRSLRRKAISKLARYPELFDRDRLARARNVFEFDDAVTAPVHGFADARDYYTRSSSRHFLARIRVPTLLLSAFDDPFLPREVLTEIRAVAATNRCLAPEFHEGGGHVGFVGGPWPWRARYFAEERVFAFLERAMTQNGCDGYD
jgi:predicted alpha/beta-fold hydrolase